MSQAPSYSQLKSYLNLSEQDLLKAADRFYASHLLVGIILLSLSIYFFGEQNILFSAFLYALTIITLNFCFSHAGVHSVKSNLPVLNLLQRYIFPLSGCSYSYYKKTHNIHHSEVNNFKTDPDILGVVLRQHPNQKHLFWHYGQFVYFPFLLALTSFFLRIQGFVFHFKNKIFNFEFGLMISYYVIHLFLIYLVGTRYVSFLIFAEMFTGLMFGMTAIVAHINSKVSYVNNSSFIENQTDNTISFKTLTPISFVMSGLDFHTEHHLFPNISPNLYPVISKKLRAWLEERNLKYNLQKGWLASLWDTYRTVFKLALNK